MPQRPSNYIDPTWGHIVSGSESQTDAIINTFMKSLTKVFDSVNVILSVSYYSMQDIDVMLAQKANIMDVYEKNEIDTKLNAKANSASPSFTGIPTIANPTDWLTALGAMAKFAIGSSRTVNFSIGDTGCHFVIVTNSRGATNTDVWMVCRQNTSAAPTVFALHDSAQYTIIVNEDQTIGITNTLSYAAYVLDIVITGSVMTQVS